jgi:hypothetical protein
LGTASGPVSATGSGSGSGTASGLVSGTRSGDVLLAIALFLLFSLPFLEYRTDDTFIFLCYARNLAAGHGLAFNPGEPIYGFTSLLWTLLLAPAFALGLPPLATAKTLALMFGVLAILGFRAWARRRLGPAGSAVSAAATFAFAANAWLVRWTGAAMETALVMALITWGLAAQAAEADDPAVPPRAAPIFALGALARPEVILLLFLTLAVDAVAGGRQGRRRAVLGAVLAVALIAPWIVYAIGAFGQVLPLTAEAKGRLSLAGFDLDPLVDIAKAVVTTSGIEAVLGVAAAVGLLIHRGKDRGGASGRAGGDRREWIRRHAVPLLWLVGLPLAYLLAGFDVLTRYALPLIPVIVLYGFMAFGWVAGPGGAPRWAWVLAAIVTLQNGLVLAWVVYPHTHRFSRGVEDCLGGLGRYAAEHTPPGTQVAIADIGAFGYYADRRVLDLAGLVSPELLPIVNRYPIEEIAERLLFAPVARPEYLVDRHRDPERLAGRMGGTFEPLHSCRVEGLGVRSPEPVTYTLYRLHWDRYEPAAGAPR